MSTADARPPRIAAVPNITPSRSTSGSPGRAASTTTTARAIASLGEGRPVSVQEAYAAGITRGQIRAALTAGTITSIRRGVIAPVAPETADEDDAYRQRIDACVRLDRDAVLCSYSAAHLLGVPVPSTTHAQRFIHVLGQRNRRRAGVWHHDFPVGSTVTDHSGIRVIDRIRAAAQIALEYSLPRALIPLEAALRASVLDLVEALQLPDDLAVAQIGAQRTIHGLLDQACAELAFRPGIARLR